MTEKDKGEIKKGERNRHQRNILANEETQLFAFFGGKKEGVKKEGGRRISSQLCVELMSD